MKAQEFLKLVGEMRREQKLFFATRREFAREKQEHLIASKVLEKQVDRVVAEGYLEPDMDTNRFEQKEAEQIGLFDEPDAADLLDTSAE